MALNESETRTQKREEQELEAKRLLEALPACLAQLGADDMQELYGTAHACFNAEIWSETPYEQLPFTPVQRLLFMAVKVRTLREMQALCARKLYVSLTSFPGRIGYVADALGTLINQTHPAEGIELWLSSDEFPEGESSLPDKLTALVADGSVSICWVDGNIMAHKKYLYAFRAHANDLVVTFDDDLRYDVQTLESLWYSYLWHPRAVSSVRSHPMLFAEDGSPIPYQLWPKEALGIVGRPSMQLLATGGAGALYPPEAMSSPLYDEQVCMEVSPHADDLWLKAAQVVAGVPVVIARDHIDLRYVPGSQTTKLYDLNGLGGGNDVQLKRINAYLASQGYPLIDQAHLGLPGSPDGFSHVELATIVERRRVRLVEALRSANRQKGQKDKEIKSLKSEVDKLKKERDQLREERDFLRGENDHLKKTFTNRAIGWLRRHIHR